MSKEATADSFKTARDRIMQAFDAASSQVQSDVEKAKSAALTKLKA